VLLLLLPSYADLFGCERFGLSDSTIVGACSMLRSVKAPSPTMVRTAAIKRACINDIRAGYTV
jgi:hypothetical protein